ncbi:MAG: c-type cytochrome [Flavobacteriales bacterium]|nr:c-type cytochrome [Flavobacteriales bacterium]
MKIRRFGKFRNFLFLSAAMLMFGMVNGAAITESITGKAVDDASISAGKQLFESKCQSCHAIKNKLVGPALKDVHKRRSYEWLTKWIRNNDALRKSGDKDANEIFEQFNKSVMTNFTDLTDDEIASLVMYIEDASAGGGAAKADGATTSEVVAAPVADKETVNKINWMLVVLFILIAVILFIIVKIIEQVSEIRGKDVIGWNKVNAIVFMFIMIIGFIAFIWEFYVHGALTLPEAATEHGRDLDRMFNITLFFTVIVFVITQFLLFYFAYRYRGRKGNKALYYPHNNKLEVIWTAIPAVVLTILVIGGLKTWNKITNNPERDQFNVEIFAYQFGWTARYPGDDGKLGNSNWNLISNDNLLGIALKDKAEALIPVLEQDIKDLEMQKANLHNTLAELRSEMGGLVGDARKNILSKISDIEDGTTESEINNTINNRKVQIGRIKVSLETENAKSFYDNTGQDDKIINNEIHIPVNRSVTFKFRARDVIHSAYIPMFRSQINVVPGLGTEMVFKAIETTNEKRAKLNDPEFDYWMICAKICGAAHFNMKLKIVVDTEEDYKIWIDKQSATFAKDPKTENSENSTPSIAIN